MLTSVRRWAHALIWGPETPRPVAFKVVPDRADGTTAAFFIPDEIDIPPQEALFIYGYGLLPTRTATTGAYMSRARPLDFDRSVPDTIEGERGGFV